MKTKYKAFSILQALRMSGLDFGTAGLTLSHFLEKSNKSNWCNVVFQLIFFSCNSKADIWKYTELYRVRWEAVILRPQQPANLKL